MDVEITGAAFTAKNVSVILKADLTDPEVIAEIASRGLARRYFAVGDEISIPWTDKSVDTPVQYDYPFIVVDIADVQDERNAVHKDGLWLMAKYAIPSLEGSDDSQNVPHMVRFDKNECEEETGTVFEANKYYYILNSGGNYQRETVTYGSEIPSGTTYYYNYKDNMGDAMRDGYNRWSHSAVRQYLNSEAEKGEGWWASQHIGDSEPTLTTCPGFLNGFSTEWRSLFKPVRVQTLCNTVCDDGVTDVTYDRIFLPSLEQVYGVPDVAGVEGKYWPWWKTATGLSEPSNGSYSSAGIKEARKIYSLKDRTVPKYTWLRTARRNSSRYVYDLDKSGYINNNYGANFTWALLPSGVLY